METCLYTGLPEASRRMKLGNNSQTLLGETHLFIIKLLASYFLMGLNSPNRMVTVFFLHPAFNGTEGPACHVLHSDFQVLFVRLVPGSFRVS